jgi:hypothetical protein
MAIFTEKEKLGNIGRLSKMRQFAAMLSKLCAGERSVIPSCNGFTFPFYPGLVNAMQSYGADKALEQNLRMLSEGN